MVTRANPNQAPTRMAPIRYPDVTRVPIEKSGFEYSQMPKPSFQPYGGNPGFGGLSQAPMFGGIGGLFNRFSRMDDETYSRGMDRYGQFRDRFGGGYQPNMFSNFAGMDDETFSRGMDRLSNYADRYGQGNPMFGGYNRQPQYDTGTINHSDPRPSQPFIDPPVTGGQTPTPNTVGDEDIGAMFPDGIPDIPDDLGGRGVVGPDMSDFNPGAATDNVNRLMNERIQQQGMGGTGGKGGTGGTGGKGGRSQPPQNTPYYGTQFAGRMQNPYSSGYGMGYAPDRSGMTQYSSIAQNNRMGYNGTGNPGYGGYASNSGKGGRQSQNPYSGRPAGGGKGGQQRTGQIAGGYGI